MKRLFLLIVFITPNCLAFDSGRAISVTSRALMKTKKVTTLRKRYEKKLRRMVPEEYKEEIAVGAASIYAATRGEVSTRPIKKLNVEVLNGNVRPDISYNFKENNVDARVQIDWEF